MNPIKSWYLVRLNYINDIKAVNIYWANYTSSCRRLDNFFLQYVKMAKIKLYCWNKFLKGLNYKSRYQKSLYFGKKISFIEFKKLEIDSLTFQRRAKKKLVLCLLVTWPTMMCIYICTPYTYLSMYLGT